MGCCCSNENSTDITYPLYPLIRNNNKKSQNVNIIDRNIMNLKPDSVSPSVYTYMFKNEDKLNNLQKTLTINIVQNNAVRCKLTTLNSSGYVYDHTNKLILIKNGNMTKFNKAMKDIIKKLNF